MPNTYTCDYCKKETDQYNEITLDGTDDIYVLEVCNKCYEILDDYFPPEDVDKMFSWGSVIMMINELEKHLVSIYGENAFKDMLNKINDMKEYSNIPFDQKYVRLGLSFCAIKAEQIINGKKEKCSLQTLVSESFGEAAMYKYNCCGGVL